MGESAKIANRRPLKSRSTGWAKAATALLLKSRVSPDQVSTAGVVISALGGWAVIEAPRTSPWLFLAAAAGVQLRLLCNMLDGLVAIEGGRKSAYGPLFNEVPDRIEDSIFLICFGYAAGFAWLGFTAALLAAVTAYIRMLGGVLGFEQDFRGPMAKPHRMAALTVGSVAALAEVLTIGGNRVLPLTLGIIVLGTALTIVRRTIGIAAELRAKG